MRERGANVELLDEPMREGQGGGDRAEVEMHALQPDGLLPVLARGTRQVCQRQTVPLPKSLLPLLARGKGQVSQWHVVPLSIGLLPLLAGGTRQVSQRHGAPLPYGLLLLLLAVTMATISAIADGRAAPGSQAAMMTIIGSSPPETATQNRPGRMESGRTRPQSPA